MRAAALLLVSYLLPVAVAADPTVTISHPKATVLGSSASGIDSFQGIPYAEPPVGHLRLRPPKALGSGLGTVHATAKPRKCPQFDTQTDTSLLPKSVATALLNSSLQNKAANGGQGEDCLTLNVQRPSTATKRSKLPVVFWIYGGGFESGSTQDTDAAKLISTSIDNGHPIVYVSVNYRLGGFGFLPGKEVLHDGASNLGLLDQRLGLQWVADNIEQFGGDPAKVTIWGESAGKYTYKGKPLFRGAVMNSGSIVPTNPMDCPKAQIVYNTVVKNAGCSKAKNTLTCLRNLPYKKFLNAANSVPVRNSYTSVALSYLPRPDGKVLTDSPELLVRRGHYAKIPFIVGDQEDEGTVLALPQINTTTTDDLVTYLSTVFFPDAPRSRIKGLVSTYPDDARAGSPFRTGILYNIYPQFKRLAAILGDITFTLTRRYFLTEALAVSPKVPSWSFLASYDHTMPVLGTYHASDIPREYGQQGGFASKSIMAYYLSFFNTLDPNTQSNGLTHWPQWGKKQQLMNFKARSNVLLADNFRNTSYAFLVNKKNVLRI